MDLARAVTDAVRAQNLTQGMYYSLFEWFHPLYLQVRVFTLVWPLFVARLTHDPFPPSNPGQGQ